MADKKKVDKDRKWRLLLYPDDPSHVEAISILENGGYKYVAILHDRDVVDDIDDPDDPDGGAKGELKKPHWHVVVKFVNAVHRSALANDLGVATNYVRDCRNFDESCLYLVHATKKSSEKFQYDISDCFGSLAPYVAKLVQSDDEGTRVLEIVKTIDSCSGRASYRDVLVWACNNGLYGEFRRLGSGVKYLLDEHNSMLDV